MPNRTIQTDRGRVGARLLAAERSAASPSRREMRVHREYYPNTCRRRTLRLRADDTRPHALSASAALRSSTAGLTSSLWDGGILPARAAGAIFDGLPRTIRSFLAPNLPNRSWNSSDDTTEALRVTIWRLAWCAPAGRTEPASPWSRPSIALKLARL
jgi:hypothetical protein